MDDKAIVLINILLNMNFFCLKKIRLKSGRCLFYCDIVSTREIKELFHKQQIITLTKIKRTTNCKEMKNEDYQMKHETKMLKIKLIMLELK